MSRDLIIWDFDGTLAHRRGETGWSTLLHEVLDREEPDHALTPESFRPHLREGFPWHTPHVPHPELSSPAAWWAHTEALLANAYRRVGYPERRAGELAAAARALYVDHAVGWALFDDVVPALQRLGEAGWMHAILSNHVPELRQIVSGLGLDSHISFVSCSAETGFEKPHPDAYASVVGPLAPRRVWMIGDNVKADVHGAESVGIPAVLVRRRSEAARFAPDLWQIDRLLAHGHHLVGGGR